MSGSRSCDSYLPEVFSGFVNLMIYNHTDLQRKGHWPQEIELTLRDADAVIIDEAHHFRNPGIKGEGVKAPSRYRQLQDYLQSGDRPKQVFFLTATPVNNSIHDFRHVIELFTGGDESYFASTLGIHSLRSHFIELEKSILGQLPAAEQLDLLLETEIQEAERMLRTDTVFEALVVQRSRAYVKESQRLHGGSGRHLPGARAAQGGALQHQVHLRCPAGQRAHSLPERTSALRAGHLLSPGLLEGRQGKPTYKSFDEGRQKQVVMLIRTLFLKRFESSAKAFEGSCWRLLQKAAGLGHGSRRDRARQDAWSAGRPRTRN